MRTKVTLVLVFLNVVLFFFIFYVNPRIEIKKEVGRRVFGPETSNIQSLEIIGPDRTIQLKRNGENWTLTQPLEWPANEFAVNRIVSELQLLEHENSFAVADLAQNGQSLADYGLEQPRLTVRFTSRPTGAPTSTAPENASELLIGIETPVGNRLYVLSPDRKRVHVVNRSLAESLSLSLPQLRADSVFTIPVYEARALTIQTDARVLLSREAGRWMIVNPINTRASKANTELTINALNALRTGRFLDGRDTDAARTGLGNPSLRVTLQGNNRRETLVVGSPVPAADLPPGTEAKGQTFFAKMEDRNPVFFVTFPFVVPAAATNVTNVNLVDMLRRAQRELRDRHVLDIDLATVTSIAIAAPGQPTLQLQRLDATAGGKFSWQIVRRAADQGPQTVTADRAIVENLLQRLSLLEADDGGTTPPPDRPNSPFYTDVPQASDLENLGFTRPEREVTLTFAPAPATANGPASTPPPVTLLLGVGNANADTIYAKLANQTFIYAVKADILRNIPVAGRVYRDRLIRELPTGANIVGLLVRDRADRSIVYSRQLGADETWEKAVAGEPAARRAALTVILAQLRQLRAKSYVRESLTDTVLVAGEERPWRYELDATLSLGGAGAATSVSTLLVADRGGGGIQLAGSKEYGVVFEMEQALVDAFWGLTYGPRDPGPVEPTPEPTAAAPTPTPAPATTPSPTP